MKWYSFETNDSSERDALRVFLKTNNIYYELSGCGAGWHFEIKVTPEEAAAINNFIE